MTDTSGAYENLQRWAATDYRLAGSGVERDCKKRTLLFVSTNTFQLFLRIFLRIADFPARAEDEVDSGIMQD